MLPLSQVAAAPVRVCKTCYDEKMDAPPPTAHLELDGFPETVETQTKSLATKKLPANFIMTCFKGGHFYLYSEPGQSQMLATLKHGFAEMLHVTSMTPK